MREKSSNEGTTSGYIFSMVVFARFPTVHPFNHEEAKMLRYSSTVQMCRNTPRSFRRRRRPPIGTRNNGPRSSTENGIDVRSSAHRYPFSVLYSFCTARAARSANPIKIHRAFLHQFAIRFNAHVMSGKAKKALLGKWQFLRGLSRCINMI